MKKSELRQIIREEIDNILEVKLEVDMSNFMRSLESAEVLVTSPTGRQIRIKKIRTSKFNEEELKVWKKLINKQTNFSTKEMELLLNMSKK